MEIVWYFVCIWLCGVYSLSRAGLACMASESRQGEAPWLGWPGKNILRRLLRGWDLASNSVFSCFSLPGSWDFWSSPQHLLWILVKEQPSGNLGRKAPGRENSSCKDQKKAMWLEPSMSEREHSWCQFSLSVIMVEVKVLVIIRGRSGLRRTSKQVSLLTEERSRNIEPWGARGWVEEKTHARIGWVNGLRWTGNQEISYCRSLCSGKGQSAVPHQGGAGWGLKTGNGLGKVEVVGDLDWRHCALSRSGGCDGNPAGVGQRSQQKVRKWNWDSQ